MPDNTVKKSTPRVLLICLTALAGLFFALNAVLQPEVSPSLLPPAAALLCLALCALWRCLLPKKELSFLPPVAGAVLAFVLRGPAACVRGGIGFLNFLISLWNLAYEDGVPLLHAGSTLDDLHAFLLLLLLLTAALLWWASCRGHAVVLWVHAWGWVLLLLTMKRFSPLACVLLQLSALGLWLGHFIPGFSLRRLVWFGAIAVLFLSAWGFCADATVPAVDQFRQDMAQAIHFARFGRDTLPEGDLRQAADMNSGQDTKLTVTTQQQKALYLRSYTGGRYRDGVWEPLPGSAYGGENSGMLTWLTQQGFDPLLQYSGYAYAGENETPGNEVTVATVTADRSRLYLPYSTQPTLALSYDQLRDSALRSSGFLGSHRYTFTEVSDLLPAELQQQSSWVTAPATEAEEAYLQAESVYRAFVYRSYTQVDEGLAPLIQELFWQDQSAPSGVYAATQRIRTVLKDHCTYQLQPGTVPAGPDPIRWFLNGGAGNSALFTSAAVEAFRACGIPARYAEGYLLQQSRAVPNTQLFLTAEDAHAWVEVYFDGMGWMPIDVTPGFYYDTYTLQQLAQSPESILPSLIMNGVDEPAEEPSGGSNGNPITDPAPADLSSLLPAVVDGCLHLLLWLAILNLMLALFRLISRILLQRYFSRISSQERISYLCTFIGACLDAMGLDSLPGWHAEVTDQALCRHMPGIQPGDYLRVSQLIEKFLYGCTALYPHEERTLRYFAQALWEGRRSLPLAAHIRLSLLPYRIPLGKTDP